MKISKNQLFMLPISMLMFNVSHAALEEEKAVKVESTDYAYQVTDFQVTDANKKNPNSYSDPLSSYNHFMFDVNLKIDNNIAKPVATAYQETLPTVVQKGVRNFLSNLAEPWGSINLLLQGRPKESIKSLSRFGLNTITTLGLADPAGDLFDLSKADEDFGQTLGVWGVPSGPYLVLPFFGPSTFRDGAGRLVGAYGSPIGYVEDIPTKVAFAGLKAVDKRVQLMGFDNIIEPNYAIVKDAYYQKREYDIHGHEKKATKPIANSNINQTETDSFAGDTFADDSFGDE